MVFMIMRKMCPHYTSFLLTNFYSGIFTFVALISIHTCLYAGENLPVHRPNIVLIIADDASWQHFGTYGAKALETPNIDKMAELGLVFENAFASSSTCTPSRSAILTGRNSFELEDGMLLTGYLPKKFNTYTAILEEAGYKIGSTGKGWGPGGLYGRPKNPVGTPYTYLTKNYYRSEFNDSPVSEINYAGNFNNFLFDRHENQPFAFWIGFHEPHTPYTEAFAAHRKIKPLAVQVPTFYPDTDTTRSVIASYLAEIEHLDDQVGAVFKVLKNHNELNKTLIIFTSDNGMPFPRAKGNLYDHGLRVPLIAFWPEVISPQRRVDDLISLTDLAPTFIDITGLQIPHQMSGKSLLDFFRIDKSGKIRSENRKIFAGTERHGKKSACKLWSMENVLPDNAACGNYPSRSIRDNEYLLIWNAMPDNFPVATDIKGNLLKKEIVKEHNIENGFIAFNIEKRPEFELYHLVTDTYTVKNLSLTTTHDTKFNQMKQELFDYLRERLDPRVMGNPSFWDFTPEFILHQGASDFIYSSRGQGGNIPKKRLLKMLDTYYKENGYDQKYKTKVLDRLEKNMN